MSYSPIIVERALTDGTMTTQGFTDPMDLYDNTLSGDNVYIKANTYDLGSDKFIWKDGVNYNSVGGKVIFASTNATATTTDDNVAIDIQLTGEWEFTNTNGLDKRIVLQNSSSSLKGFKWVYKAMWRIDAGSVVKREFVNTLGASLTITNNVPAHTYTVEDIGIFTEDNVYVATQRAYNNDTSLLSELVFGSIISGAITFYEFNKNGALVSEVEFGVSVVIEVKP